LWAEGSPAILIIVGREGWKSVATDQRRNIPLTVEKLTNHPELGKRLFWLSDISDEYLQRVYAACTCLIFASEAEGFGLPLIEAAKFGKPILARDIPVFREIARDNAYYFSGLAPEDLASALRNWLGLHHSGAAPSSSAMQWNTWSRNVEQLIAVLTCRMPLQ
jgi:glycosyltransferase involved in cell wall biosynthesis